jgi:glycosyltransferase
MKLSVVTVAYNSAATIGDTIRSFLAQRHPDKELIVVDGASKDDTVAVARAFNSPLIRIVSEEDKGPFDAMNKGLRLATGDAIGVLNSDDIFHDENSLAKIDAALADADIVYGDLNMVRDHASHMVMRVWEAGPFAKGDFRKGWLAPHPTLYMRRAVFERIGEFDISYRLVGDYDLALRAMELNDFRIRYIPEVLADFQLGGLSSNNWKATLEGNWECLQVRRKRFGYRGIDRALFGKFLRSLKQVKRVSGYYKA